MGESMPWLEWIVRNYDDLPGYAVFLHGDQKSWHSTVTVGDLLKQRPANVKMLSKCYWRDIKYFYSDAPGSVKWGLDLLYKSLFGIDFTVAWTQWHMSGYICCAECVVTAEAIRNIPKKVYQRIIQIMS